MSSLIHPLHKYLLAVSCVLGTELGAGDNSVTNTKTRGFGSCGALSLSGETALKQVKPGKMKEAEPAGKERTSREQRWG